MRGYMAPIAIGVQVRLPIMAEARVKVGSLLREHGHPLLVQFVAYIIHDAS